MQTKCPHCHTVFKVSDEHLKAADGYVRCGICKEVFNALKDKSKNQPPASNPKQPEPSTGQNISTNKISTGDSGIKKPIAAQKTGIPTDKGQKIPVNHKANTDEAGKTNIAAATAKGNAQTDLFAATSEAIKPEARPAPSAPKPVETETTIPKAEEAVPVTAAPPVTATKVETRNKEETAAKANSDIPTAIKAAEKPSTPVTPTSAAPIKEKAVERPASDTDDNLFDGVQSKLIPDEYRIPELHNTYSVGQDLAWSLAIIVLTASLFIEYAWFNRNELVRNPQLRPVVSYLCGIANCDTINLREPDKIEMTTRNIYTHPNVKNALMISGTLVNHADFEQAYPNILIDFSDVRGEVIASRTFTPEDYLQIRATSLRPLPPELPVDFNIEIKDPGKNAMTYEFTFM